MFGMPLMLAGGIAWISGNGIRLVVEHVNGPEAVGLLSVGWGLGQRLSSVVAMLVTAAAFPLAVKHMVDGSREGAVRQLAMGGAILYGLVAPATAGILLITRPMVELMISPEFREMTIAVLPMAAVAGAVRNLRIHFCDQIFILFEQTRLTIIINAVETVSTVVLCFVGAVLAGPVGAVAGCLAGAAIGALFAFVFGMVRFGLIVPWDHVARISAASAVMSAVLMTPGVAGLAHGALATILVKVSIAGLVYPLALAALYPLALRGLFVKARAMLPAAS
jgi:O-antigen/teichoic acid export membrane protein